jgi:hypothetical protein
MKKVTKKLALSRETLGTLDSPATLRQAAAGQDTTTVIATRYPSCGYCDLTMGC